jgi:dUTP pyrophosphatase
MRYQKISFVPNIGYAKSGDAGLDLVNAGNETVITAQSHAILSTGIAVEIPEGHFGLVLMRSGHGFKKHLISHPGIIDSGYRGEIKVKVFNLGSEDVTIAMDERFCQLTIVPFARVVPEHVPALEETDRGATGFGSSGS